MLLGREQIVFRVWNGSGQFITVYAGDQTSQSLQILSVRQIY